MPIYEYRCKKCGFKFEELQSIREDANSVICPKCNTPGPERLLSIFGSSGSNENVSTVTGGCNSSSPFT